MHFLKVGSALVGWGLVLCYTTKGEYYNSDEVQAMVAAEMLEEKRKKKEEEEMFDDIGEMLKNSINCESFHFQFEDKSNYD